MLRQLIITPIASPVRAALAPYLEIKLPTASKLMALLAMSASATSLCSSVLMFDMTDLHLGLLLFHRNFGPRGIHQLRWIHVWRCSWQTYILSIGNELTKMFQNEAAQTLPTWATGCRIS
jgi:hypothetical protein